MHRALTAVEGTTATDEELLEAQRIARRLDQYDTTIEIWERRAKRAAEMLKDARSSKELYIKSVQRNTLPFYIPSGNGNHCA